MKKRRVWCCLIFLVVGLICAWGTAARPADLMVTQNQSGFIVENPLYRLTIDVSHGGAIRSFHYKKYDPEKEWIYPNGGGLLEDMIQQQSHPGELQDYPYEYKILVQTPENFQIEMWRAFKQAPYPGLVLRKVITLTADSPAIRVTMTLENPTEKAVFPSAWIQNRFLCGGHQGVQAVYAPSSLGIRMVYIKDGHAFGDGFVRKPSAGWMMTFDQDLGAGLLNLVDYNYLQMDYSCISYYTTEWFYDRVLIQPLSKWTTSYTLVPVRNVFNCYYADDRIFVTVAKKGKSLAVDFRAVDAPVKDLAVNIRVDKSDRSGKIADVSARLSDIDRDGGRPVMVPVPGPENSPVIVTLLLGEGSAQKSTEFLYSPDQNVYYAPESASPYRVVLPKKQKPELMSGRNLALQKHKGLTVLYGIGLYSEFNRMPEILRCLDPEVKIKETFLKSGVFGPELTYQPLLAEELLGYDLIIMDNVGANALGESGEIAVSQYVKAGGSLLVCGGVCTLGKGRFEESPLRDVIPVVTAGFFDIKNLGRFKAIKTKTDDKTVLGTVEWIQRVKSVKPGASVLLTADGEPLFVTGSYGKGKAAVWLGTPMGDAGKGNHPYWENPDWLKYMQLRMKNLLPDQK